MARKKRINFGFTPSIYQEKFFDFIQHGVGNAVIKATAGSGKTATAVSAMKLIPSKEKCLFLAFNKSIADELNKKLEGYPNVTARTSHSLGLLMLRRNLGNGVDIDEYKYRTYTKSHITELTTVSEQIQTRFELEDYISSILLLNDFARFNYCQSEKEIDEIAKKYSIPINFDECQVVLKILKWGKENTETIDYTDMIWLPVELNLKPLGLQYDWVMVDEAQDISCVAFELFKKCFKRGTRFVAIGDNFQQINTFAGASEKAFENMCSMPNTQIFELPISYRCDKKIVQLANKFVPTMQSREGAEEGIIFENCHIKDLQEGDMILARTKAPLVKLYTKLLTKKMACYIKGQDIASNLIKIINSIDKPILNADLKEDGFFLRLYEKLFRDRNKLMQKRNLDYDDATLASSIMEQYDNINTLLTLAKGLEYKDELIDHIKTIFKEDEKGICLSTIHKAKGLEADNVYILCRSKMPSSLAKLDWEKTQENNLIYVAYTRAKHKLGFISEKEVPPCGSLDEPMQIINDLMYIENKICKVLNTEPTVRMSNVDIAKFNISKSTKIEEIQPEIETINKIKEYSDISGKGGKSLLAHLDELANKYAHHS